MLSALLRGSRTSVLVRAGIMIALIAFADWRIDIDVPMGVAVPLGFLYLFPMLLAGSVLNRWQIAIAATVCTFLTESFDTFDWLPASGIPRDILYFAAFFCMGLFVYEVGRSRQFALENLQRIENEIAARREAEEQLKVLVESSPVAIFTTNADGRVLLANEASHRLFGLPPGELRNRSIRKYLPSLLNVPPHDEHHQSFRTVMQGRGHRETGEVFLADIWFSTYRTSAGSRLAAMVVDASDELRTREEASLHQLLAGSRILVGAVSHEVRNVCGAIAVVHANLARSGALAGNKDFEALGTLILALEKIAALELQRIEDQAGGVDLYSLLEELRIVVDPSLEEAGIEVNWVIAGGLPSVWADRQSLMQVFLNLIKNSERAMLSMPRREITIMAASAGERISVRFRDSGCGVRNPERLFRPFQQGAQATGLGLYLSRAFTSSFRGDVRYEEETDGSSFIVELSAAPVEKPGADWSMGLEETTASRG
jgi:two-component system sensor kinase FixL